jgi:hypothetical protein
LGSETPTERLPEKPCDAYAWSISIIFNELLWDFSYLLEEEDTWIARMRGLGREEELEDTVSHLSIYLTGLDRLYREQAKQLKHQIRRAEKAEQELEIQWRRTIEAEAQAESSLESLPDIWRSNARERERIVARRREAGLLEGEPEETHWSNVFHQRSALTGSRKNPLGKGRVPKLELSS